MFPRPRCEGCGSRDACDVLGVARAGYPACRTPLRGVSAKRMAALLAWLGHVAGAGGPEVTALTSAVTERFGRDGERFSDILELSYSSDAAGEHLYRFSYALPGFRADEPDAAATLLAFCRPFGPPALDAARTALRAARSPAVAQLLFGFAYAAGGASRVKLYLQFHDAPSAAALELASRMLGPRLRGLGAAGRLHLLCLDVGANGLSGAKLYFVTNRLDLTTTHEGLGPVPLLSALAGLGVSTLRDVLTIHRLAGPDDEGVERPSDVDFSLPDNNLLWSEVRALPYVQAHLARSPRVADLASAFRLATRRISGSNGDGRRLNVYYTLAEVEPNVEAALAG